MLAIKQLLSTFAPGNPAPMQMTLLALVTPLPAAKPKAVLLPAVLLPSAAAPIAVEERPIADGRVPVATIIFIQRKGAEGTVRVPARAINKRGFSNGRFFLSGW